MKKNAIVLGGTEDHKHLIRLLQARGYRVSLIDYLADSPAAAMADQHIRASALDLCVVLDAARAQSADLITTWCIDQTVLIMAQASEQLGLPCYLSAAQALSFTNKASMKCRMVAHGIPTSRHVVFTVDDFDPDALLQLRYPIVIKPVDANSSKGVLRVDSNVDLESAVASARRFTRCGTLIAEEFVNGSEFSADFFLRDGEPTLLVSTRTYKLPIHSDRFVICNSMSPNGLDQRRMKELDSIVRRISKVFEYRDGPLFVQFISDDCGLSIVEFGARVGGGSRHHFIRLATGFDYLEHLVEFSHGVSKDIHLTPADRFIGCQFAYGRPGIIHHYEGLDECRAEGLILDYFIYKGPGATVSGYDASNERPFGFIAGAASFDELRSVVARVDARIRIIDEKGSDMMLHGLHFAEHACHL